MTNHCSPDNRALAEELREFTAMKYAGNCKCGKCQLVPRALVERIYHTLNSVGVAQSTGERIWCMACGTVTRNKVCDCNIWPDGHEMKREPNFVNYADEMQKTAHGQAQEIDKLETALKASRLVLIERGVSPESRIIGVIDTALTPLSSTHRGDK